MQLSLVRRLDETGIPLLAARLVLGVTFLVMGWEKGWDPVAFLKLLREYEMIPDGFYVIQNIISVVLPWIEVVCGVALILGVCIRGSALSLLLLLTFFTVLIIYRATMIHLSQGIPFWGIHFDCGCGGGDVHMYRKIPENLGLWILSWIALLSHSRRFCLASLLFERSTRQCRLGHGSTEATS